MTNSEAVSLLMNSQYYKQGYKQGVSDTLDKIRAEIESYKLSEDELSDMDEDSVKWGMKIACDIVDKYKAGSEDGNDSRKRKAIY